MGCHVKHFSNGSWCVPSFEPINRLRPSSDIDTHIFGCGFMGSEVIKQVEDITEGLTGFQHDSSEVSIVVGVHGFAIDDLSNTFQLVVFGLEAPEIHGVDVVIINAAAHDVSLVGDVDLMHASCVQKIFCPGSEIGHNIGIAFDPFCGDSVDTGMKCDHVFWKLVLTVSDDGFQKGWNHAFLKINEFLCRCCGFEFFQMIIQVDLNRVGQNIAPNQHSRSRFLSCFQTGDAVLVFPICMESWEQHRHSIRWCRECFDSRRQPEVWAAAGLLM